MVEKYPNHVVAKWLGHSPMIAATRYLQTREHHFEDVVSGGRQGELRRPEKGRSHLCVVKSRRNKQRLARNATTRPKTRDRAKRCELLLCE